MASSNESGAQWYGGHVARQTCSKLELASHMDSTLARVHVDDDVKDDLDTQDQRLSSCVRGRALLLFASP